MRRSDRGRRRRAAGGVAPADKAGGGGRRRGAPHRHRLPLGPGDHRGVGPAAAAPAGPFGSRRPVMEPTPATQRLVARATRPAVRAGDPLLGSPVTVVEQALAVRPTATAAPAQAPMSPHAAKSSLLPATDAPSPLSPPSTPGLAAAAGPTVAAAGGIPPVEGPEDPSGAGWATGRRAAALTAWLSQPALGPPVASSDQQGLPAETATATVTVTETPSSPAATAVSTADALAWLRSKPTGGAQDSGTPSNVTAVPATPIVVADPRP